MQPSLRIALLLDPLSIRLDDPRGPRFKWGNHAPALARELLGLGHTVRGFGAPPGLVPRSGEPGLDGGGWRTLRSFSPDVVLAFDALSTAALRGAREARRSGAALLLVEAALRARGKLHERVRWKVGEWLWGRLVRRTARGVVALDPLARRQALAEGFAADQIAVIPQGVSLADFRPGLTSTIVARHRVRGRILLYAGRLDEDCGLDVLLTAFARTVGQRSDWSLVLAGDGPAAPRLRAQAIRLGISAHVHWPGRVRREELPGLMGASTLFAVPATGDGVLGRQVARALACGLPVLASDVPRLRALVENQHHGLVVGPGDVAAWTEAIRLAAGSPLARRRWACNARLVAEERLGWEAVARQFVALFHACLAQPAPGRTERVDRGEVDEAETRAS